MRVRYVDAAVGAAISRHRIYRERYSSPICKRGVSLPLSLSLSRTRGSLDRRQVSGLRRCIPSILLFDVCTTFFFFFFFRFFVLSSLSNRKIFFPFLVPFFLEGSRGNLVGFSMIMDLSCSKREA